MAPKNTLIQQILGMSKGLTVFSRYANAFSRRCRNGVLVSPSRATFVSEVPGHCLQEDRVLSADVNPMRGLRTCLTSYLANDSASVCLTESTLYHKSLVRLVKAERLYESPFQHPEVSFLWTIAFVEEDEVDRFWDVMFYIRGSGGLCAVICTPEGADSRDADFSDSSVMLSCLKRIHVVVVDLDGEFFLFYEPGSEFEAHINSMCLGS